MVGWDFELDRLAFATLVGRAAACRDGTLGGFLLASHLVKMIEITFRDGCLVVAAEDADFKFLDAAFGCGIGTCFL